MKDKDE